MSARRCEREQELLDALPRGFLGAELEEHLLTCPSCAETRMVAGALLGERAQAITEAPVPSAATMLWRVQMRQRQEARARAQRSLLVGQALTLAVAIALAFALFGGEVAAGLRQAMAAIRMSAPLLLVLAISLLLAPIAGYVAIRQK